MAKSKSANMMRVLLLTCLYAISNVKSEGSQPLNNAYPQPWELSSSGSSSSHSKASHAISSSISTSTYYHSTVDLGEPVLCLLRGISIEQTRNQSRNFYECPGRWPAEFIECCDDNKCCAPNYVRQYLQEKVSEFEKLIVIFCLSFLVIFLLYLLCFFLPCCPLKWFGRAKKNRDYAGCATKMTTEGPQYQTMGQEQCPSMGGGGPILLNHRGVQMQLGPAQCPMPPMSTSGPSYNRVAIAETALVLDGSSSDEPSNGSNSSTASGSHIVTIHANSSRGSSPTTDSSLISLVPGNGFNSARMISSTFSRPPVKSILKLNQANSNNIYNGNGCGGMQMQYTCGQNQAAPATIKPFGYRDPRNSIVSCTSSLVDNGSNNVRCPVWPDHPQML